MGSAVAFRCTSRPGILRDWRCEIRVRKNALPHPAVGEGSCSRFRMCIITWEKLKAPFDSKTYP